MVVNNNSGSCNSKSTSRLCVDIHVMLEEMKGVLLTPSDGKCML